MCHAFPQCAHCDILLADVREDGVHCIGELHLVVVKDDPRLLFHLTNRCSLGRQVIIKAQVVGAKAQQDALTAAHLSHGTLFKGFAVFCSQC